MLKEGTKTNMAGGTASCSFISPLCAFSFVLQTIKKLGAGFETWRCWSSLPFKYQMLTNPHLIYIKTQGFFHDLQGSTHPLFSYLVSHADNFSLAISFTCKSSLCSMKTLGSFVNNMTLNRNVQIFIVITL